MPYIWCVTQKRRKLIIVVLFLNNEPQQQQQNWMINWKVLKTYTNFLKQGNWYVASNIVQRQGFSHFPWIGTKHADIEVVLISSHRVNGRLFVQFIPMKLEFTIDGAKKNKKSIELIF